MNAITASQLQDMQQTQKRGEASSHAAVQESRHANMEAVTSDGHLAFW